MKKLTAKWVQKAESDYAAARRLLRGKPLRDVVCFHCQQVAEKYLKALMQESRLSIPKTHDIALLIDLLKAVDPALRSLRRGVQKLSSYAVETRYPGLEPTARETRTAMEKATRFRSEIRRQLGLRTR